MRFWCCNLMVHRSLNHSNNFQLIDILLHIASIFLYRKILDHLWIWNNCDEIVDIYSIKCLQWRMKLQKCIGVLLTSPWNRKTIWRIKSLNLIFQIKVRMSKRFWSGVFQILNWKRDYGLKSQIKIQNSNRSIRFRYKWYVYLN